MPKVTKIVLNTGVRDAVANSKAIAFVEYAYNTMTGQKPVVTRSKKSIAAFKLREGIPIGVMVTLRKKKMNDFFERLVAVALPRVRDFRGVPRKGFDGRGNYTMGLKEQIVFPEISYDQIEKVRGMDIIVTTTAKTDDEARELLKEFQFPFVQQQQQ